MGVEKNGCCEGGHYKRAAHLLECAEENFHCACALLAVQLFLTYPLTVFLDTP